MPSGSHRKTNPEDEAAICRLRRRGWTIAAISSFMSVGDRTVALILRRNIGAARSE